MQQDLDRQIRAKAKYNRVEKPAPPKSKIGLLLIATGKYHRYVQALINSADNLFFNNDSAEITYYLFSDNVIELSSRRKIVQIHVDHKPFPFASMDRFKFFTNNANQFATENYLYYVDVDCLFVDKVANEILGNLTGVRHCGFYNTQGPYESNVNSCLYAQPHLYKHYFGGGFSGGKKESYLALAKWCSEKIEQDVANGIIPLWHDETALNRYFLDHPPDVELSPSYHYPQGNRAYYEKMWSSRLFPPKIMLLEKDHASIRA